jgi:hypothetical protein
MENRANNKLVELGLEFRKMFVEKEVLSYVNIFSLKDQMAEFRGESNQSLIHGNSYKIKDVIGEVGTNGGGRGNIYFTLLTEDGSEHIVSSLDAGIPDLEDIFAPMILDNLRHMKEKSDYQKNNKVILKQQTEVELENGTRYTSVYTPQDARVVIYVKDESIDADEIAEAACAEEKKRMYLQNDTNFVVTKKMTQEECDALLARQSELNSSN